LLAGLIPLHTPADHGRLRSGMAHLAATAARSTGSPAPGTGEHEEGAGGHSRLEDRLWTVPTSGLSKA